MQEFSSGISENVTWNGDQPISMGIVGLSLWIDAFFGMSFDTVNIICVFCVFQFGVGVMIELQSILWCGVSLIRGSLQCCNEIAILSLIC